MKGSAWRALLVTIVFVQLTAGYRRPEYGKQLGFSEMPYASGLQLLEQETDIVHTGNAGSERIFAFAAHDPSNKTAAAINILSALDFNDMRRDRRAFPDERCKFDFDVPDNSEVVIDSVRRWYRDGLYSVSFTWHIKGEEEDHVSSVDSMTCQHAEWWRYENRENPTDRKADMEKIEKPEGYYFVDEARSNQSTVLIKYANLTSASVRLAAAVPMPKWSGKFRRYSLTQNKFGVCWTENRMENKQISCTQGPIEATDGQYELENWPTLMVNEEPDFLGAYNSDDGKMLVVVGNCADDNKKCDDFQLFEMRDDGGVFWHTDNDFRMGACKDPREISVSPYYDTKRNRTCIDEVCTDEKKLKYRRMCANLI